MGVQQKRTALVTGATKGIGRAIAFELARAGYDVLLAARSQEDLHELEDALRIQHPETRAESHACDLATEAGCVALLRWASQRDVSVLINNLGIFHPVSVLEETEADFAQQWQANYVTPHRLARGMALEMIRKGEGHIVNITSVAAKTPVVSAGTYSVTKAALRSLTRVLREELRAHGIRVTEVVPGSTKTASWSGTSLPDSRFVMPSDVAGAVRLALDVSEGASIDEVVVAPRQGNI